MNKVGAGGVSSTSQPNRGPVCCCHSKTRQTQARSKECRSTGASRRVLGGRPINHTGQTLLFQLYTCSACLLQPVKSRLWLTYGGTRSSRRHPPLSHEIRISAKPAWLINQDTPHPPRSGRPSFRAQRATTPARRPAPQTRRTGTCRICTASSLSSRRIWLIWKASCA